MLNKPVLIEMFWKKNTRSVCWCVSDCDKLVSLPDKCCRSCHTWTWWWERSSQLHKHSNTHFNISSCYSLRPSSTTPQSYQFWLCMIEGKKKKITVSQWQHTVEYVAVLIDAMWTAEPTRWAGTMGGATQFGKWKMAKLPIICFRDERLSLQ